MRMSHSVADRPTRPLLQRDVGVRVLRSYFSYFRPNCRDVGIGFRSFRSPKLATDECELETPEDGSCDVLNDDVSGRVPTSFLGFQNYCCLDQCDEHRA
jgi:hypothetical protein